MGRVSGSFAVNAFLGVPFAEPPTGPRRWSSPAPIRPWKGVRPAAHFAPNCMQLNPPAWSTMRKNVSEDCAPTPPARSPVHQRREREEMEGGGPETTHRSSRAAQACT